MGIWDSVFGSTKEENSNRRDRVNWTNLTESGELKALIEASYRQPQLIFKHSMTCGVSGMTKRRFEAGAGSFTDHFTFHLLVVQKSRELSTQIAVQFRVRHESPQLLVIKEGALLAHASHWQIDSLELGDYQ
ncbi:MAG: bacillithiol system redox-active protein YtxJ [Eudoraea sp.]|nr:bacillithiol system redox-active protein YtxJ [Eudoraea sp.]